MILIYDSESYELSVLATTTNMDAFMNSTHNRRIVFWSRYPIYEPST